MSRGLNKVLLIGHLGKDPELSYTNNGMAIAKFSLATTEGRKNSEGNWEDSTEWHNIVMFGKTAENAGQYLKKGSQVYLEGRISTRKYEKDGQTRYFTDILVNTMLLLGRKGDSSSSDASDNSEAEYYSPSAPSQSTADDDDIPF